MADKLLEPDESEDEDNGSGNGYKQLLEIIDLAQLLNHRYVSRNKYTYPYPRILPTKKCVVDYDTTKNNSFPITIKNDFHFPSYGQSTEISFNDWLEICQCSDTLLSILYSKENRFFKSNSFYTTATTVTDGFLHLEQVLIIIVEENLYLKERTCSNGTLSQLKEDRMSSEEWIGSKRREREKFEREARLKIALQIEYSAIENKTAIDATTMRAISADFSLPSLLKTDYSTDKITPILGIEIIKPNSDILNSMHHLVDTQSCVVGSSQSNGIKCLFRAEEFHIVQDTKDPFLANETNEGSIPPDAKVYLPLIASRKFSVLKDTKEFFSVEKMNVELTPFQSSFVEKYFDKPTAKTIILTPPSDSFDDTILSGDQPLVLSEWITEMEGSISNFTTLKKNKHNHSRTMNRRKSRR